VGGTVGDIESLPFLEAIRQLRHDLGRDKTFFIHTTWLPFISSTGEIKSKPTQHSVRELRSIGITPNMIIARADHEVDPSLVEKISLFCDVEIKAVIPLVTSPVIYSVPMELEKYQAADYILNYFGLKSKKKPDWTEWKKISAGKNPKNRIKIALVGKYIELHDAYLSVREAIHHASFYLQTKPEILWIHSYKLESGDVEEFLKEANGILVPGGFGKRGVEGKILAARYARENLIPYLGLCLGMQLMVVEFARFITGESRANSTEFDDETPCPVIDLMPDQKNISEKGGTMRLGLYPCKILDKTIAARAYRKRIVEERHRHRYELNNTYRAILESGGMVFSGQSPDNVLVEIAELKIHPFMLGTQFHPEFLSRPNRPHPLFIEFIKMSIKKQLIK